MAKFKPLPPLEELQKVLSYDPETGVFTWIVRPSQRTFAGSVAGTPNGTGYTEIRFKRRGMQAHRLAWLFATGKDPGDYEIDHINRDRRDNRIQNLRLATPQQQRGNTGLKSTNSSGFRGVCWRKEGKKWRAQIMINGKYKSLGLFATKEEAAEAYQKAAAAYFGEFLAS